MYISRTRATCIGAAIIAMGAFGFFKFGNPAPGVAFPNVFTSATGTLISSEPLTHNSKLLRFGFPPAIKETGVYPAGTVHARLTTPISHKHVHREYSPIYTTKPELLLAVKLENPDGGSGALLGLEPGQEVTFDWVKKHRGIDVNTVKSVNMIAGGSGIAPLYSVSKYLMTQRNDAKVNLLFANKTPEDIMFKKELDDLKKEYPDRMNVTYFVSKNVPPAADVIEGHIDEPMLREKLWKDANVYVCGPKRMMKAFAGWFSPVKKVINGKVIVFH